MPQPRDPFNHIRRLLDDPAGLRRLQKRLVDIVDPPALRRLRQMQQRVVDIADPPALRRIREAGVIAAGLTAGPRYAGALGVATNLDNFVGLPPGPMQTSMMRVGTDVTRMLSGSSTATAWAEAMAVHARIAELARPKPPPGLNLVALSRLEQMSEQLTGHTRVLAHLQVPALLQGATADSTHGWQLTLDDARGNASLLLTDTSAYAANVALATAVSARVLRPTIVLDEDEDDLDEPQRFVDALTLGNDFRARVRTALDALDPRLLERWDGAWERLLVEGPDGPSQAAHSIQELLDSALRLAAPDDDVLAWHVARNGAADELNKDGRPTRGLRVRYIVRERPQDKTAKLFSGSQNKLTEALQQAKHAAEGPLGPIGIQCVLLQTEALLGYLLVTD